MFEQPKVMACNAAVRDPHVSGEFLRLEKSVESLGCILERVADQMSPVTREVGLVTGSSCPPDEQLVPLAERLRSIRRRVESMADRMDSVSQRIEL